MTPTETEFFAQLERLAAYCCWEQVDLWAVRQPEGQITFTAYGAGNREIGLEDAWGAGTTPEEAVDRLMKAHPHRDPERCRDEKIAKLKLEIAKLQNRQFTLPPYRPTPMIGAGNGDTRKPEPQRDLTIDV